MKKVRFEIEESRSRTVSPQPQPQPKPDPDAIIAAFELQRERQLQPQLQPQPQPQPELQSEPAAPVRQPASPVSHPALPIWTTKMAPAAYLPTHNKLYFAHGVDMNQSEMLRLHGNLILDDDWPPSQRLGSITGYEWFISHKFTPKIAPSPSPTEKVYGVVYQVDQLAIESFTEMGRVYDMQMKMVEVTYYKPDFESNIGPPPMVEGEKVLAYCLVGEWAEGDKDIELLKDGDGKVVGEKAYYRRVDKMSPLGQLMTAAIVEANVTLKMPMGYIRDHIRRFIEEPRDTVESGYHAFNNQRSDRCCVNRKY
jgi:hypothetical protein